MKQNSFDNIRIVMVETSHPGNIGATARAMKTMCLQNLHLVSPKFFPSAECTTRASGADDILENATIHTMLGSALNDCNIVYGTTARKRSIEWPILTPEEAAREMVTAPRHSNIAVLFGRENSGLRNEELDLCHRIIRIPTNPGYSSLNIAASIQIISYELLTISLDDSISRNKAGNEDENHNIRPVTTEEMEMLYKHLQQTMTDVGFFNPEKPRYLIRRLKRLFNRAQPDRNELNILRGFLAAVQKNLT